MQDRESDNTLHPSSGSMTVREFSKVMREGIQKEAARNGWNADKAADRGNAFSLWVARVVHEAEETLDPEPEEALLRTKDLKADLVFEDPTANHLVICQCKYVKEKSPVDETEVIDFFSRHEHYMKTEWVREHGSSDAVAALEDYAERFINGGSVQYYFVSNGDASKRIHEAARTINEKYRNDNLPITCELLDLSGLKEYYIRSMTLGERIPAEVTLQLPEGRFFEVHEPHRTLVAVLKGNALRNLGKLHKQSLYAWNIRGYLGNRGINKSIGDTAKETPGSFFYFNNGVAAICTDYVLTGNRLIVDNFQIINGAQTVTTLEKCPADDRIQVLFRLTKTESVKTEKGMNKDMIRCNNTQNIVKVSDFRANDEIQLYLEKALAERKVRGPIPKVRYQRKRAPKKPGTGDVIRLEEMAKIRYAYLCEPTLVHSSPRLLWTLDEDSGSYEKAFGVDGRLESAWSDDTLEEALLAYVIYAKADQEAVTLGRKDVKYRFLRRLRFHTLSLAGIWVRENGGDEKRRELARSKDAFESFWRAFWPLCLDLEIDAYLTAVEGEKGTLFALVRSDERWQAMRMSFSYKANAR